MTKLFAFAFALTVCTMTFAQDITVLVNGKPGGTFFARSNFYAESLADLGYSVNVVDAKKSSAAAEQFNNTDEPTMMVWMNALAPKRPVEATADNFVAIEYSAPLYLCAVTGETANTVGAPNMYVMDPVLEMLPDATVIPYKNTGAVLNAALAGEIDYAYINQGKAGKLRDAGYACKPVPGVAQMAVVLATNIDVDILRKDIISVQQSAEFVDWHTERNFNTDIRDTQDAELQTVNASEEQWKSAAK